MNKTHASTNGDQTIRYGFTVKNETNSVLEDVSLWTYVPVNNTSTNKPELGLNASLQYKRVTDENGSQLLHFRLDKLPPYGSRIVRISAKVGEKNNNLKSHESLEKYLKNEPLIETDNPAIQEKAFELKEEAPLNTTENIFNWVSNNIKYTGYIRQSRGALYALKEKKGDCTEFMYLFVALARANSIPARAMGGYVVHGDAILDPSQYHNWAEFYVDGKWHIADPQRKNFLNTDADYIAMQILSDAENSFGNKGKRFWHSHEKEISVRMNSGGKKGRTSYSGFRKVKEHSCSTCPQ